MHIDHTNFLRTIDDITYIATDKTIATVIDRTNNECYTIAQIRLHNRSIYVLFCYIDDAPGVVGISRAIGPGAEPDTTDSVLGPSAKLAPVLVKYSHHPDGRAHFSQQNRVLTAIKRQSFPLTEEGHLFTLSAFSPRGFHKLKPKTKKENDRVYLSLDFPKGFPHAVSISGQWWSIDRLRALQQRTGSPIGPTIVRIDSFGKKRGYTLIGPTDADPTHLMLVGVGRIRNTDVPTGSGLAFSGGLDGGISDYITSTEWLTCIYPLSADEASKYQAANGSIAYIPAANLRAMKD